MAVNFVRDQRDVFAQYYNRGEYLSFTDYLHEQGEILAFFLQKAAEEKWDRLRDSRPESDDYELGSAMYRWWDGQFRRFYARLRIEKRYERLEERNCRLAEKLAKATARREAAEAKLQSTREALTATQADLHEANLDLCIAKGLLKNREAELEAERMRSANLQAEVQIEKQLRKEDQEERYCLNCNREMRGNI